MRAQAFFISVLLLLASQRASAQATDPAAARAQLQQGYALKQQGKCDEALPHFVESVRLDRQPKGLVNLADCEEKLGKLAAAQMHFVEVRDLARAQGLEALRSVAEQHLTTLERRMPKLVVTLAKDAPPDAVVTRDGVELGRVSLNTPLPTDPGRHVVTARANNLERRYEVTVAEAETKLLEVTPTGGEPLAPPKGPSEVGSPSSGGKGATDVGTPTPSEVGRESDQLSASSRGVPGLRVAGYIIGGLGVAGLVVGTVAGLKAKANNEEAEASCPEIGCDPVKHAQFETFRHDAMQARTLSIVGFVAGGAALVGGTILVLAAPRQPARTGRPDIRFGASLGLNSVALAAGGTW